MTDSAGHPARSVRIGDADGPGFEVSNAARLALIAGPCQLETLEHARMLAGRIAEACAPTGTPFVFKASYDKANRSSLAPSAGSSSCPASTSVTWRISSD